MPTWSELEAGFRELEAQLRYSRLDVQWGTSGEYWRLAGSHTLNVERRFEALAHVAGEKLGRTLTVSTEQYEELLSEANPVWRWYKALWKIGDDFRFAFTAQELDENDTVVGHLYTGSIEHPAESSSVLCLEISARYPEQEGQQSLLRSFWEKYGGPVVIGVAIIVLSTLILAIWQ